MAKESLVLCDTNIIIDFYKENPSVLKKLRTIGQENIAVSIITVGELLYGALNKKELRQINEDIAHLHLFHLDPAVDT
ncbi:MAG TPA: PIN domain-containing protein [Balneolaceae bacterium]